MEKVSKPRFNIFVKYTNTDGCLGTTLVKRIRYGYFAGGHAANTFWSSRRRQVQYIGWNVSFKKFIYTFGILMKADWQLGTSWEIISTPFTTAKKYPPSCIGLIERNQLIIYYLSRNNTIDEEESKLQKSSGFCNVLTPEMVNVQFGIPHIFEHRTQKDEYVLVPRKFIFPIINHSLHRLIGKMLS